MSKFKKTLALSLTAVMTLTTLASAMYNDTDNKETKEAIEMLSALGIIKGYGDGTFKPENEITRAEFAKMIYVLKNGGNDDGAKYYADSINAFSDTNGHWAEGYINYCYSLGIIDGLGNGKFAPEDNITGVQASKLALTIMGYDADVEGLVGSNWSANTIALASENSLFDGYSITIGGNSTREYASQLLYNALNAETVKYFDETIVETGETVGEKYLSLNTVEGVLISTGEFAINSASADAEKLTVQVGDTKMSFESEDDFSHLIGMQVKVVVDEKDESVYGVYALENEVISVSLADVESYATGVITIDGEEYDVATDAKVFIGETESTFDVAFATPVPSGKTVTFISNNDDEIIDLAIIKDEAYGEILGVYKDKITTNVTDNTSLTIEDIEIYEGYEKGDFVVVSENLYSEKVEVSKMDVIEGEVTASRSDEVKVGDTWYKLNDTVDAGTTLPALGSDVAMYVVNSYIYAVEEIKEQASDFAVVKTISAEADLDGNFDAKLVFVDGTEKTVSIDKAMAVGSFVTFDIDDEIYEVTEVSADNLAGFDNYLAESSGLNASTDKLGSAHIEDDALIFVKSVEDTKTEYTVMTGAEFKALDGNFGTSFKALTNTNNGYKYVNVAVVDGDTALPGIDGTTSYGFVTDSPYITSIEDEKFVVYTVFNGVETIEITEEASSTTIVKGDYVSFDIISDLNVEDVEKVSSTDAAVVAYDENTATFMVNGDLNVYEITEDTKVIYVDHDDLTGVEDGEIILADKTAEDAYINNISFKAKATAETNGNFAVEVLIVDINNELV